MPLSDLKSEAEIYKFINDFLQTQQNIQKEFDSKEKPHKTRMNKEQIWALSIERMISENLATENDPFIVLLKPPINAISQNLLELLDRLDTRFTEITLDEFIANFYLNHNTATTNPKFTLTTLAAHLGKDPITLAISLCFRNSDHSTLLSKIKNDSDFRKHIKTALEKADHGAKTVSGPFQGTSDFFDTDQNRDIFIKNLIITRNALQDLNKDKHYTFSRDEDVKVICENFWRGSDDEKPLIYFLLKETQTRNLFFPDLAKRVEAMSNEMEKDRTEKERLLKLGQNNAAKLFNADPSLNTVTLENGRTFYKLQDASQTIVEKDPSEPSFSEFEAISASFYQKAKNATGKFNLPSTIKATTSQGKQVYIVAAKGAYILGIGDDDTFLKTRSDFFGPVFLVNEFKKQLLAISINSLDLPGTSASESFSLQANNLSQFYNELIDNWVEENNKILPGFYPPLGAEARQELKRVIPLCAAYVKKTSSFAEPTISASPKVDTSSNSTMTLKPSSLSSIEQVTAYVPSNLSNVHLKRFKQTEEQNIKMNAKDHPRKKHSAEVRLAFAELLEDPNRYLNDSNKLSLTQLYTRLPTLQSKPAKGSQRTVIQAMTRFSNKLQNKYSSVAQIPSELLDDLQKLLLQTATEGEKLIIIRGFILNHQDNMEYGHDVTKKTGAFLAHFDETLLALLGKENLKDNHDFNKVCISEYNTFDNRHHTRIKKPSTS